MSRDHNAIKQAFGGGVTMIKFLLGAMFGAFVGMTWMCLCCIVDDIDELDEWIENNTDEMEEPEDSEDDEWTDTL